MAELTEKSLEKLVFENARKIHSKNHIHDHLMYGAQICLKCKARTCNGDCQRFKDELKRLKLSGEKPLRREERKKNDG